MRELTDEELAALREALDDEHRAVATYDQVMADFGPVRPFVNIREAEARHIAALARLYARFGLSVPPNPWPGKVPRYPSIAEACRAAVASEIENAKLYDRLLACTGHAAVRAVFLRLREASQLRHLPAFQRCLARGSPAPGRPLGQAQTVDTATPGPPRRRRRRRALGRGSGGRGPGSGA